MGDGRQLCPMDRIKSTLWKMSPFGPRPTSHAQTNQPTHGFARTMSCKKMCNILGKISPKDGSYQFKIVEDLDRDQLLMLQSNKPTPPLDFP